MKNTGNRLRYLKAPYRFRHDIKGKAAKAYESLVAEIMGNNRIGGEA